MKNRKEYFKKYYIEHKEKYNKNPNKEHSKEYRIRYMDTIKGYATQLVGRYNHLDRIYGRPKGDLTVEWVMEQIQKGCTYKDKCGTTDWRKIGLNRKDNSLPHTKANCEPCCWECNQKLEVSELAKKVYQYTIDGELINVYEKMSDVKKYGYKISAVSDCCNSKRKTHHKCKWSFVNLT